MIFRFTCRLAPTLKHFSTPLRSKARGIILSSSLKFPKLFSLFRQFTIEDRHFFRVNWGRPWPGRIISASRALMNLRLLIYSFRLEPHIALNQPTRPRPFFGWSPITVSPVNTIFFPSIFVIKQKPSGVCPGTL